MAAATHRPSAKKKGKKLVAKPDEKQSSFASFVIAHEIDVPGAILACILAASAMGSPMATKMVKLSYETSPGSDQYDKGSDDAYFVAFWVLAFTFLRAFVMRYVFTPFAKAYGADTPAKQQRFAEQGFWIQQWYVLHIEKRRKDHYAMLSHHVITFALIVSSYCVNFTRIGNAVLCCMDFADILLPFAKILNYLNLRTICDIAFGLFAVSWLVTRHILFTIIIWSTAFSRPQDDPQKYMDMKWEPEKGKYFTPTTQKIYLGLFLLLDMIILFWFAMILKVIIKVLTGNAASDTRSDSEDSGDEDDKQQ
ncbi:unnamed protein product [Umbelopsis sp. WA50703]